MTQNSIIKNKSLSKLMSSAKKAGGAFNDGLDVLNGLRSDSGFERIKTIGKIIAKIYSGGG